MQINVKADADFSTRVQAINGCSEAHTPGTAMRAGTSTKPIVIQMSVPTLPGKD